MAHKTNVVVQAFSNVLMVSKLEDLFQSLYVYYLNSPKCHFKCIKLVKIVETWGFKIFFNVKIQWISIMEPLKCVPIKYNTLIVKMLQDNINIAQAKLNFNLLCDLHTFLTLYWLLSLLDVINVLVKFVQGTNVFICNFIAIVKIC